MSTNSHDDHNRPEESGPNDHGSPQGASHHDWRDEPPGGMPGDWCSMPSSYDYTPRRRILPTLLPVILLLSAVGVGIYFWTVRQGVQDDLQAMDEKGLEFIDAFIDDLKNDRLAEAYKSTSAGYRHRTSPAQFEAYVRKHKEALQEGFKNHKFRVPPTALVAFGKKVTGDYEASRKTITGATEKLTMQVVREQGALKIEDLAITP